MISYCLYHKILLKLEKNFIEVRIHCICSFLRNFQVHRALKHAVNAGLLRHRSGRYKAVFTLNPAPIKQSVNENNEQKSIIEMNMQQRPSSVKMIKEDNNNRLMSY